MDKLKARFEKTERMTNYRDYEFDRRANDLRRLTHAINHFDDAVTQGMIAMKGIASALEAVGQAFTEITLGSAMASGLNPEVEGLPTEQDMRNLEVFNQDREVSQCPSDDSFDSARKPRAGGPSDSPVKTPPRFVDPAAGSTGTVHHRISAPHYAASMASTRITDEANSQVRRLARIFAEEARRINAGAPFQSYNTGVHRDVVNRLLPVKEHLKGIVDRRRAHVEALERYNRYKTEVEKIEKKYAKKGKPFCDSKSHKKFAEKRDAAWDVYTKCKDKFNETFDMLMEVNDHAAAQTIHRYLSLNSEYLKQVLASFGRILPAMAEAYPLNSEYSSEQNTMLVDAVAAARKPFRDHSKTSIPRPATRRPEDDEAHSGEDEEEEGDDFSSKSASISKSSMEEGEHAETSKPLLDTEEGGSPLQFDSARKECSDRVTSAEHQTRDDHGHVLTQPRRLQRSASNGSHSD